MAQKVWASQSLKWSQGAQVGEPFHCGPVGAYKFEQGKSPKSGFEDPLGGEDGKKEVRKTIGNAYKIREIICTPTAGDKEAKKCISKVVFIGG